MSNNADRMTRIVDPWFLVVAVILTLSCLAILLQSNHAVSGWILVSVSIAPVYVIIYKPALFTKAMLFHKEWARQAPLAPGHSGHSQGGPGVAIIITSRHEIFEVAKMTFDCAYLTPYHGPREIIVVDDSLDTASKDFNLWKQYVESHAEKDDNIRVLFHHNRRQSGPKPDRINLVQTLVEAAQYTVFLQAASSISTHNNFLARAVNEFEQDDRLGVLQFHTVATNDHFNRLTGPVAVAQSALRIEQLIRANGGFAAFQGHNAMWRRTLLDINGPWLEPYCGTAPAAEDLLKSISAYAHGYTICYLDSPTGEWVPSSLGALESIWMQRTYGGLQILFKNCRQILAPQGLSPLARIDLLTLVSSYALIPLFLPISILWYLVFPSFLAGALALVMIVAPPLISAWTVRRRYTNALRISRAKKAFDLFAGVFLINTFVLSVELRTFFGFLVEIMQSRQSAVKGSEERTGWRREGYRNSYAVALAATLLVALTAVWGWNTGFAVERILDYLPLALISANLLLCVLLYGRQDRKPAITIQGTHIDGYNLRNSLLNSIPLFAGTDAQFQHQVALSLRTQRYPSGVTVMKEGEVGREVFFVIDGAVESNNGWQSLFIMEKGSFIGGRSLIYDERRAVTVRTIRECELAMLDKETFLRILQEHPRISRRVTAQIEALTRSDLPAAGRVPSGRLFSSPPNAVGTTDPSPSPPSGKVERINPNKMVIEPEDD